MYKSVTPIQASRSRRVERGRGVTTGRAGKIIPLRYIPLLREDQLKSCRVNVTLELAETVRPLINAVYADVEAWFVPFAAFERFADIGDFNRSYAKQPDPKTGQVEPFIKSAPWSPWEIMVKLGIHAPAGATVNLAPIEAYNCLVNHKYQERSPNLPKRSEIATNLAACFWAQNRFAHLVPNYDRSFIDGVVPVEYSDTTIPVKGMGTQTYGATQVETYYDSSGATVTGKAGWRSNDAGGTSGTARVFIEQDPTNPGRPNVHVDLGSTTAVLSLANIDLARKTAAFDALRTKYEGHEDAEIIELLMEGIRVPEFMERQPMLLASRRTQFSFGTRYATDGASLDQSVTNGVANIGMNLTTPRSNTGGIVMIVASVVPDQMFERRRDPFLSILDQDLWPKYERDSLMVEPVDHCVGADLDTSHASPAAVVAYEPLNQRWNRDFIRLGGDLWRPNSTLPWDEDRAVLWVTEPVNPTLTTDWYLANSINAEPFKDQVKDHLTITTIHDGAVEGHTVFGPALLEIPAA